MLTFDKAQTTTTQNVASRLVIPVEVTGLPVPMVSWTFSNGPLDGALVKGDDTFTNLTIESLDSKQQGVYTLKAINAAGEATAQFTVNLQGMKNLFSVFVNGIPSLLRYIQWSGSIQTISLCTSTELVEFSGHIISIPCMVEFSV